MAGFNLINAHQRMTAYLERHSVGQPRLASEIIIAKTLGINRIDIYARFDRPVTGGELDAIRIKGRRLAGGEPLQLVVGDAQFLSYFFRVEPGVFIPRPETEILVETAAEYLKPRTEPPPEKILDLCAGCGVVAISLLKLFPEITAEAVDISPKAAMLAADNARGLGVAERFIAHSGDHFSPLQPGVRFDAVLANPPYIPSADIVSTPAVVKDYDPRPSLDGGADGLDVVRRIIGGAPDFLKPGGLLALEIGFGQADETQRLMREGGFSERKTAKDLAGIERIISGCHPKEH